MDDAPESNDEALVGALRSILEDCARTGLAPMAAKSLAARLGHFEARPLLVIVADSPPALLAAAEWAGGDDLSREAQATPAAWNSRLAPPRLTAGAVPPQFDILLAGLPASALDLLGATAGLRGDRPVVALAARQHDEPWPAEVLEAFDQADMVLLARPQGAAPETVRPQSPLTFDLTLPDGEACPAARALTALAPITAAGRLGGLLRAAALTRGLIVAGVHELDERVTALKADQGVGSVPAGPLHAFQIEALAAAKRLSAMSASGRLWAERPTGDLAAGIAAHVDRLQGPDIVETQVGHAQELALSATVEAQLRAETGRRLQAAFGERLEAFAAQLSKEQSTLQDGWAVRLGVRGPPAARALQAIEGWLPTTAATASYARPSLFSGMVGARSAAALITLILSFVSTRLNLDPHLIRVLAPAAVLVALALALGPIPSTLRARAAAQDKAKARLRTLTVQQYCEAASRAWTREIQPQIEDAISDFRLASDAAAKTIQSRQDASSARRREALSRELQAELKVATAWRRIAADVQNRLISVVSQANRALDRQRALIVAASEGPTP